MDIIYLLHALAKRKWIIISSTLLAFIAAFGYTYNQPKMYKSSAELSTGFTQNNLASESDQNLDVYAVEVKFDNVIQTMISPQVIELLSDSLLLHDLIHPATPFRFVSSKQRNSFDYRNLNLTLTRQILQQKLDSMQVLNTYNPKEVNIIELLQLYKYDNASLNKELYVYRVKNTDYIQVEFQSENPDLSAFVVNTLCTEFLRHYGYSNSLRTTEGINTLKTLMDQKKDTLDSKFARIRAAGGTVDITAYPMMINEYQSSIQDLISDSVSNSFSLSALDAQLTNMGSPSTGGSISQNNADIITLTNQIQNLNEVYINGGQKDEALHARIDNLRKELQNKVDASDVPSTSTGALTRSQLLQKRSEIEVKLQTDRANILTAERMLSSLNNNEQSAANRSAFSTALQKEVDLALKDYTAAKERYTNALDQVTTGSNFKEVLYGQPAVNPEPSKRYIIIGISGISVFLLCALVILFLEYLDISLKTPFQFSKLVDIKLISTINDIDIKKGLLNIISRQAEENERRENVFRELLRKLRFEIEKSGFQIILFTSTRSGAGKTTLVQALAYSLSLSKKKVLILDTNFCNNDLTIQLEAKPTLESISMDHNHLLQEELKEVLTNTSVPLVDAIGCKGGDYTPLEILPKNNLLDYLHELTKQYDYIFLEGAPLNDYSDSRELLGYVDGVVVIFSAKYSINQVDKESIEFLKSLNKKLVGAILNKVELRDI